MKEKMGIIYRWKRTFQNMKLAKKMILIYSLLAGASAVISIAALQICLNIYDEKLYEKSLQELDFFTQQINESLEDVELLSYSVAMNGEMQERIAKVDELGYLSMNFKYELYHVRNIMQEELNLHNTVENIIYTVGEYQDILVGTDCGVIPKSMTDKLRSKFTEANGGYVYLNPTKEYPYLLSGRDILEKKNASLKYLGSLILTTDIGKIIKKYQGQLDAPHAALYVYSDSGMIYQQEEEVPELPKVNGEQGYKIVNHNGQQYFMCYLQSKKTGWMYVNMFPYSEIFGQTTMVRYWLIIGFLGVFLAAFLMMRKIARIITRPLEQLSDSMQIVENGDFQGAKRVIEQTEREDEVGCLIQEFHTMLDRIDTLIYENYEKQILLQDTKYKMLQAQINPHFLYNTLNAINWMIRAKKTEDASRMIMELGGLLRSSFAKEPYTTVAEEIRSVKSYITIQQYRYKKRVEFVVESYGNVDDFIVPRMILQPLVENSICYGVENSITICKIRVEVREEENKIAFLVSDTGPGMSEEELEKVRTFTIRPKGHGIGLKNIWERLNITYEESEFFIDSTLGHGTLVRICIPKIRKDGNNV